MLKKIAKKLRGDEKEHSSVEKAGGQTRTGRPVSARGRRGKAGTRWHRFREAQPLLLGSARRVRTGI